MAWWVWIVFGVLLCTVELLGIEAQFYFIFLGVSALTVGLLSLLGLDVSLWMELLIFAAVSVVTLVGFRRRFHAKLRPIAIGFGDALVGETGVVREALRSGAQGTAELRGTTWTVRNVGAEEIPAGARITVEHTDGLLLQVRRAD